MKSYTRTASLIIAIALLAAALTQSSVSAAPRTPEQIMQQAKQVVVGGLHACALMEDGSVWCWGNNEVYQLGNSDCVPCTGHPDCPIVRCPPVPVQGLPGQAEKLSVYGYYTCAIMQADGSVWCWGASHSDAGNAPLSMMPEVTDVKEYIHPCALTNSGELWCRYMYGCDLDVELRLIKQNVASVSFYGGVLCLITNSGELECAGENAYGRLGNDKVDSSCYPLDVFNPFPYTTFAPSVSK